MRYFVTIGDREMEVDLGGDAIRVDGEEVVANLMEMDGTDLYSLLLNQASHQVLAGRNGTGQWNLHLSGHHLQAGVMDERTRAIRRITGKGEGPGGPRSLKAPMPGLVVKVEAREGDRVVAGQGLVIVEAMKMENELKSEADGTVSRILVEPGQAVDKDQVLVEFEASEAVPDGDSEGDQEE